MFADYKTQRQIIACTCNEACEDLVTRIMPFLIQSDTAIAAGIALPPVNHPSVSVAGVYQIGEV